MVATLDIRLQVENAQSLLASEPYVTRFGTDLFKRETVSVPATSFLALTPPTVPSAPKAVMILPGTRVTLTLKGVTGDTGVKIAPGTNPLGMPVVLPLGASVSIGLYNGDASAQEVTVIWL